MNNNVQTPKGRVVLVGLCAAALFLWAVAVYVTYQDSKMTRYNVSIKPGAVNYGTHSTVTMPPVMHTSYRHSTPMISGDAVRAYAHTGHATMPMASYGSSSGFRIHTTSSATVHSIGGGGSTGGGGMMSSGGGGSSSRGIRYSGGSVSIPMLAMASTRQGTQSAAAYAAGPRKVKPNGNGIHDGEERIDEGGVTIWTYNEDAEDWFNTTPLGTRKYDSENGYWVEWNGSAWVKVGDQADPSNVPVGEMPWLMFALLMLAYCLIISLRRKQKLS